MKKRTLLSMSLALMLGMTSLTTPVWATHWDHDAHGKNYKHKQRHARGDGPGHRRHQQRKHQIHKHHDWRHWRHRQQQLRRDYAKRYQRYLRDHYRPYDKHYWRHYKNYRPKYHHGGHQKHGYSDPHAYDDRSGLTIIYRAHPY